MQKDIQKINSTDRNYISQLVLLALQKTSLQTWLSLFQATHNNSKKAALHPHSVKGRNRLTQKVQLSHLHKPQSVLNTNPGQNIICTPKTVSKSQGKSPYFPEYINKQSGVLTLYYSCRVAHPDRHILLRLICLFTYSFCSTMIVTLYFFFFDNSPF